MHTMFGVLTRTDDDHNHTSQASTTCLTYKIQSTIDLRCRVPRPCVYVQHLRVREPAIVALRCVRAPPELAYACIIRVIRRIVSARAHTARPCMHARNPAARRARVHESSLCVRISRRCTCVHRPCAHVCAHSRRRRVSITAYSVRARVCACVHRPSACMRVRPPSERTCASCAYQLSSQACARAPRTWHAHKSLFESMPNIESSKCPR